MKKTTTPSQPPTPPCGWVRRSLRFFLRSLRLLLILILLSLLAVVWYLHEVGLPESVKQRVIAQFKAQGWDLEFSRLRWRGVGLIVAETIQLHRSQPDSPQLFIEEARCEFHHSGLKNFHLELDSIALSGGHVLWPLPATNRHSSLLVFNDLEGRVQARSDDAWELSFLRGSLLGVKINLRGTVQHASQLSQWKLPKLPEKAPGKARLEWGQILDTVRELQFAGTPEITIRFQADAATVGRTVPSTAQAASKADIKFSVPGLRSPWGSGTNLLLTLALRPWSAEPPLPDSAPLLHANIDFSTEEATTPWGAAKELRLHAEADPTLSGRPGSNTLIRVVAIEPVTPSAKAKRMTATVQFGPGDTNSNYPTQILLVADAAQTRWGQAQRFEMQTSSLLHYSTNPSLHDISGQAHFNLKQVQSQYAEASQVLLRTDWHWPELQIEADAHMYDGGLLAKTALNATNREVQFSVSSDIDVQPELVRLLRNQTNPLLTNTLKWVGYYTNLIPPKLQAEGRVILPGWTIGTNWAEQLLPTLSGVGNLEVGPGAYHGAFFLGAESSFALTNMLLTLPRIKVEREEGIIEAEHQSNLRNSEFQWRILSQIFPNVAQAFFDGPEVRQAFDDVVFTTPPWVQAELQGSWREPKRLLFDSQVRATNFILRGEHVKSFEGRVQYTNQLLSFIAPVVERVEGTGRASLAVIDFSSEKLYLSNGVSRLDPYAITRAIGKDATEAIAPYQFAVPPYGEVNGVVDLKRHSDLNDLHFKVQGGTFRWGKFELQKVGGQVDWVSKTLVLTNVQGDLRNGRIDGHANFDFEPEKGPVFACKVNLIDADLQEVLSAWGSKTNHIEGRLNAEMNITEANAQLPQSWQGYGWVSLRDGLLWEIPMFGLFSPALNAFAPGLGNSRARKGTATYMITNSVISTTDLEIHATAMRMQIQGTVGFDNQVDGRVEAELLRDVPAVGLVVSKVFWPVTKLFEYKVSGALDRPKAEPVYVLPKILMAPFHPIKSLKDLMREEKKD